METFFVTRKSGVPLLGCIQFGIIDRGTDLIQIRPTTVCNLKCLHCSTSAGELSSIHQTDYVVELDYLLEYAEKVVKFKGVDVEANIDSAGEPTTYPKLLELVEGLKRISTVKKISMQTNGVLLTEQKVKDLEKAGLNRINLSVNALDGDLARLLSGVGCYNVKKIVALAEFISKTTIELWLCPVWIPKVNDEEILKIVDFAKKIGAKVGIQKYEIYRYSRKIKKAKALNWWKFYKQLAAWEKETGVKLDYRHYEGRVRPAKRLPQPFKADNKIYVTIKAPGWMKNQMISVAEERCVTIDGCKAKIGNKIKVKILEDKNGIYLAGTS